MKRISLLALCCLHLLFSTEGMAQKIKDRHQAILNFSREHAPLAHQILTRSGDYRFQQYMRGKDFASIVDDFSTIVHETTHHLSGVFADEYRETNPEATAIDVYYLNSEVQIRVTRFDVFNAKILAETIEDSVQTKIFRFRTYLAERGGLFPTSTQPYGIYGMMDELNAYAQGTSANLELFDYFKEHRCDGYNQPYEWIKYVSEVASSIPAYYEFRLFISWYLQHARKHEPEIFDQLWHQKELRVAYTLIEQNFAQLLADYEKMRSDLIVSLGEAGHVVALEKSAIDGEYVLRWRKSDRSASGMGIYEDEILFLKGLLMEDGHQILEEFKVDGVTMENYQDYLR